MHTSPHVKSCGFRRSEHRGGVCLRFVVKGFAVILIALTVLPFTAPFPACDLGNPFAPHTSGSAEHSPEASVLTDRLCSHALPFSNPSSRIRFVVVAPLKHNADRPPASSPCLPRCLRIADLQVPSFALSALRI
jgi:hypothetical protein